MRETRKRAEKMLDRGIYRARGSAFELIEGDPRVAPSGCSPRKLRPIFSNGDGFASIAAVKGLPVAGDEIRLFMGKRPTEPPRDFPTVEISRQFIPCVEPQLRPTPPSKRSASSVRILMANGIMQQQGVGA